MITSAENRAWEGDIRMSDLDAAGLPVASVARTAKIATIEMAEATRVGQLSIGDRLHVAAPLHGLWADIR